MQHSNAVISAFISDLKSITNKPENVGAIAHTKQDVCARTQSTETDRHTNQNKQRISLWMDADLLRKAKQFCHLHNITYTAFFESAAAERLNIPDVTLENVCARISSDDDKRRDKRRTDDRIINPHVFWSDAYNRFIAGDRKPKRIKWTDRDDGAADEFRHVDARLIESAIILTLSRKPIDTGPVSRFLYFSHEIRNIARDAAGISEEVYKVMLQRYRENLGAFLNVKPPTW